MKKQNVNKKLVLVKKTISNLDVEEMKNANGGYWSQLSTCPSLVIPTKCNHD